MVGPGAAVVIREDFLQLAVRLLSRLTVAVAITDRLSWRTARCLVAYNKWHREFRII